MEVEQSTEKSKTSKRRLKKLCTKIKQQMEFYFSDSNLAKDKFLIDLISKDPEGYVDLKIFTSFNKVKALTENCDLIASSVSKSSLFKLSEDQKRVKRVTPIELTKDFDSCTLYVEKLPAHADQKWLMDVFGHFGTIKYVNVPRYKVTSKIKGFAFVEFEAPDSVKNACEYYKLTSEKECTTSEDESKSAKNTAQKHRQDESPYKKNKKGHSRSTSESSEKLADSSPFKGNARHGTPDKSTENTPKHKRRRKEDSVCEGVAKKLKLELCPQSEELTVIDSEVKAKSESPCKKLQNILQISDELHSKKEMKIEVLNESETEDKVFETEEKTVELDESKNKRKRRHSKKHRSDHADKPPLRVMPKSEWKTYRNKYLELQRSTMSMLKKQILLELQELKDQDNNSKATETQDTKKSLKFQPGVIIKVKLSEPIKNSSDIKDHVKSNAVVAYIDAPVESSEIFIRCHSPEDAQLIIKDEKFSQLGEVELLKDTEEKQYWEKIENDRLIKFSNPVPHKKRGRDKLIAKAAKLEETRNKHIYFDE